MQDDYHDEEFRERNKKKEKETGEKRHIVSIHLRFPFKSPVRSSVANRVDKKEIAYFVI